MKVILIFLSIVSITIIESKITIDIDLTNNESIKYSGVEHKKASDSDLNSFFPDKSLKELVTLYYGTKPKSVYYKNPTPWGDIYDMYKWQEVTKITSVKGIVVKSLNKKPVVVFRENFDNKSNKTVKINAGLSHVVENSISTTWSKSNEVTISQNLDIDIEIFSSSTGISYTSTWGRDEEKTETVTVGSTTAVEIELQPGQSITSILSVTSENFDIDVTYKTSLRGNLAVNYKKPFNGHRFWAPQIQDVMNMAGIKNEKKYTQTIRFGLNDDAKLEIVDRYTGKVL